MSTIVVKNSPIKLDYRLALIADPESTGIPQVCTLDVFATCTVSIDSNSTLGSFIAGLEEAEIKANEPYQMTMKLFANGLQEAISNRDRDAILTKESLPEEVAAWEKAAEESANARYAESYQMRISDIRIGTARLYDKDDTTMLYEWIRPAVADTAASQWTCPYCESVMTSNFCTNCGAARK